MKKEKALTLKTLTKSNVWDIQENDVFRLWEAAEKDSDLKDCQNKYVAIIRSAFEIEEVKINKPEVIEKYNQRGFKVGVFHINDNKVKYAIKKRPILRVTDLTYENIRHISAAKLMEVLERNFGGGWDSLPQSIQDIIQSGFEISTTTLPKDRLHKAGGLYEKKVNDGFEVLEIPKGSWTEAIFAKEKPMVEKVRMRFDDDEELDREDEEDDEAREDYAKMYDALAYERELEEQTEQTLKEVDLTLEETFPDMAALMKTYEDQVYDKKMIRRMERQKKRSR